MATVPGFLSPVFLRGFGAFGVVFRRLTPPANSLSSLRDWAGGLPRDVTLWDWAGRLPHDVTLCGQERPPIVVN